MPARTQEGTQVKWSAADTKSILADGNFIESDDFTIDGNMIAVGFTINGNSDGSDSNDIVEVHCRVKKDPNNSNGGVPDTYDTANTFILSLDCSNGNDNQETSFLDKVMAGDIIRFACKNNGTNAITVGIRVTEDLLTF